ncbi:MAG: hypothetical protein J6W02_03205 [Bacteroidaceae bacterium]|nr:hypothetical protein [Bacteroidaceae bacterium]
MHTGEDGEKFLVGFDKLRTFGTLSDLFQAVGAMLSKCLVFCLPCDGGIERGNGFLGFPFFG